MQKAYSFLGRLFIKFSVSRYFIVGLAQVVFSTLISLILSWLFYPGLLNDDTIDQIRQSRGWIFHDTHPPILAASWRLLDFNSVPLPLSAVLVQNFALCLGLSLIIFYFSRSLICSMIALVFVIIFPPILSWVGHIYKDVTMVAAFLLSFGLVMYAGYFRNFKVYFVKFLSIAVCVMLFSTGVRYNAFFIALVMCPWALAFLFNRRVTKKGVAAAGILIALVISYAGGKINKSLTTKRDYSEQFQMLYDLAGISIQVGDLLIPPDFFSHKDFDLARLKVIYKSRSDRSLYATEPAIINLPDPKRIRELSDIWINSIIYHPIAWLVHRFNVFQSYLFVTKNSETSYHYGRNSELVTYHPSRLTSNLYEIFDWFDVWLPFIFRPWFYLLLNFLFVLYALMSIKWREKNLQKRDFILFLNFSALIYQASFFLFTIGSDFKYSLWSIFAAQLSLVLFFTNCSDAKSVISRSDVAVAK